MAEEQNLSPAEVFDRCFGPALLTPGARLLVAHAQPQHGERVLDHACGTGTVAREVAPLVGVGGRVVGLDINPGMLAVARSRPAPDGAAIEWREGDAASLDAPDGAFDLVLCQQGVQYFADRAAAVREMHRVLAPGGRAALNVWQALDLHPLYEALNVAEARYLNVPLADVSSPWSFPNADVLRALLESAGFQRVSVVAKSFDAQFPSPERFVYLTLLGAVSFLPEFNWEDEPTRNGLIDAVNRAIEPVLRRYRAGNTLTFPVFWHFASAHRS